MKVRSIADEPGCMTTTSTQRIRRKSIQSNSQSVAVVSTSPGTHRSERDRLPDRPEWVESAGRGSAVVRCGAAWSTCSRVPFVHVLFVATIVFSALVDRRPSQSRIYRLLIELRPRRRPARAARHTHYPTLHASKDTKWLARQSQFDSLQAANAAPAPIFQHHVSPETDLWCTQCRIQKAHN